MVLSLSTKCGYCQDSLPFYKRLIEEHRKSADSPSLVALFPNSEMEVNEYKRQNQLDVKSVANVNPSSLNLKGTPTLILVDAEGKVSDVWVGKLSTNDEQQVISRLQHR